MTDKTTDDEFTNIMCRPGNKPDLSGFHQTLRAPSAFLKRFTKSQIYFDFVPPSLNNFEYFMKKLSSIDMAIQDEFPSKSSQIPLRTYMSFTFVYGNHLDLKQASLALFDAEPVEQESEDNASGIIVVYLDTDMTLDMLKDATDNTDNSTIDFKHAFLAVHSKELMQNCNELRKILTPHFGKEFKVIDACGKMELLYEKFADVIIQAFEEIERKLQDLEEDMKGNQQEVLCKIKQRLLALRKLYDDDISDKVCGESEKSLLKLSLSSLKNQGLQGYTTGNNTLFLCFKCPPTIEKIKKDLPVEVKDRFPNIKTIQISEPFFIYHHTVVSGDKLHPFRGDATTYGTVGMFGSVSLNDGSSKRTCCISSPHVICSGQTAHISNAAVTLGNCIWPPAVDRHYINVEDISVICLEQAGIEINRKNEERITLFKGDRIDLKRRKVYKFGATTSKTTGFIQDAEFVLTIGDPVSVFLIEPEDADDDEARFSKPGDSGAIVLTKFGQHTVALSMIFGGEITLQGFAKNNSIAVDLQRAIKRFETQNEGQSVQLDIL